MRTNDLLTLYSQGRFNVGEYKPRAIALAELVRLIACMRRFVRDHSGTLSQRALDRIESLPIELRPEAIAHMRDATVDREKFRNERIMLVAKYKKIIATTHYTDTFDDAVAIQQCDAPTRYHRNKSFAARLMSAEKAAAQPGAPSP